MLREGGREGGRVGRSVDGRESERVGEGRRGTEGERERERERVSSIPAQRCAQGKGESAAVLLLYSCSCRPVWGDATHNYYSKSAPASKALSDS